VLLAESAGLTLVLGQLLDPGDRLSRLDSLRDLADRRALEGADLVVLDRDPLAHPPESVADARLVATMVAGEWVYGP
jgi:hypothetical protein